MAIRYFQYRTEADDYLPKHVDRAAEIGVDAGEHAYVLVTVAKPKRLYLVDVWSYSGSPMGSPECKAIVENRLSDYIATGQVQLVQQPGVEWLNSIPEGSLDWAYLDTLHEYDCTVQELEAMRRAVKLGGVISGHDFTLGNNRIWKAGVVRAVLEAVQDGWLMLEGISDEQFSTWIGRRVR